MFLQATVDAPDTDHAKYQLRRYQNVEEIDYVEIGAPMVTHYGVGIVDLFRQHFPVWRLYADLKIIDFPVMELTPYLEQGIRRTSAMAVMNDGAFQQLAELRDKAGLSVLVSFMGYPLDRIQDRVWQLSKLGFCEFIAHGAGVTTDAAFANMQYIISRLSAMQTNMPSLKIVAAGGIGQRNAAAMVRAAGYHGLIVGRGLCDAHDVELAAKKLRHYGLSDSERESSSERGV